jgi:hypothetical protein
MIKGNISPYAQETSAHTPMFGSAIISQAKTYETHKYNEYLEGNILKLF